MKEERPVLRIESDDYGVWWRSPYDSAETIKNAARMNEIVMSLVYTLEAVAAGEGLVRE